MAVKTIYRFGKDQPDDDNYWFSWDVDVNVVKGALAEDVSERTYWTGNGLPKVTDNALALLGGTDYPMNSYTLGVPKPASAPAASVTGTGSGSVIKRAYVYRYVSSLGEMGPPSEAVLVDWQAGQTVTISSMSTAPAGAYNMAKKELFRSESGNTGAAYFKVKDVGLGTTSTTDTVATQDLGDELDSTWYFPPPTDMFGLTSMANGIMVGFSGYNVCFSEPFLPHAWDPRNRFAADAPIVGGVGIGSSLLVCTTEQPFILTGTFPSQMTPIRTSENYACLSKRSICSIGGGAAYASQDGLVIYRGGEFSVVRALSKDKWEAYNPSSIHAYVYDGRYYAFWENGSSKGLLVFNFTGEGAEIWESDIHATAGYVDNKFAGLYLAQTPNIYRWDGGPTLLDYRWRSKIFVMDYPVNMSCAQVSARSYPVTFRMYADGVLRHTQNVQNEQVFRLPGGYKADEYEVEVEGEVRVNGIDMATSVAELKAT